jgi:hypothetical protein
MRIIHGHCSSYLASLHVTNDYASPNAPNTSKANSLSDRALLRRLGRPSARPCDWGTLKFTSLEGLLSSSSERTIEELFDM